MRSQSGPRKHVREASGTQGTVFEISVKSARSPSFENFHNTYVRELCIDIHRSQQNTANHFQFQIFTTTA